MTVPALGYINIVSNFIPLGTGCFRFRSLRREYILFMVFVFMDFLSEVITLAMAFHRVHNLWVLQIYDLAEYILLILILSSWLTDTGKLSSVFRLSIIPYTLFWFVVKFNIEPFNAPDPLSHTISCMVLMGLSILVLLMLVRDDTTGLGSDPRFWITISLLIYFTANVTFFFLGNEFIKFKFFDAEVILKFHWMTTIIMNVLSAIGLWKVKAA